MTRSGDWNGNISEYDYDSFGRLVRMILPGDSRERPTRRFEYIPGDAQRNLVYRYTAEGQLVGGAPEAATGWVANVVVSRSREDISESGDYNVLEAL